MEIISKIDRLNPVGLFSKEPASTNKISYVYKNIMGKFQLVENGDRLSRIDLKSNRYTLRYTISREIFEYKIVYESTDLEKLYTVIIKTHVTVIDPIELVASDIGNVAKFLNRSLHDWLFYSNHSVEYIRTLLLELEKMDHESGFIQDLTLKGLKVLKVITEMKEENQDYIESPNENKEFEKVRQTYKELEMVRWQNKQQMTDHRQNEEKDELTYDVFISHSSKDKLIADAVCNILESKKIKCWISYRDILPGQNYSKGIIDGLNNSKLFVLIYSANSAQSRHVKVELERAFSKGLSIIQFRLEKTPFSSEFEYFTSSAHWLDALTEPREKEIMKLAEVLKKLLDLNIPS